MKALFFLVLFLSVAFAATSTYTSTEAFAILSPSADGSTGSAWNSGTLTVPEHILINAFTVTVNASVEDNKNLWMYLVHPTWWNGGSFGGNFIPLIRPPIVQPLTFPTYRTGNTDMVGTTFNPGASRSIDASWEDNLTGSWRPTSLVSAKTFNDVAGMDAFGTWHLVVQGVDHFDFDTLTQSITSVGEVTSWSLAVEGVHNPEPVMFPLVVLVLIFGAVYRWRTR